MLRIDRSGKTLKCFEAKSLPDVGLKERGDLQRMIRQSPDAFFAEMGERLLLVGEEVRPAELVDDRIDLLAIDEEGTTVVIELKRGSNKFQLLQALSYAGMIAKRQAVTGRSPARRPRRSRRLQSPGPAGAPVAPAGRDGG